ncbi:hypothetical protein LIER_08329 [Lithospermum erythrorhizon]|uniref:Photosynthetic NDH subcomplex L 3 n=1 Tax=Lithospermum erythrorhizon TaxID=34254 RepID=A0AAV3PED2_LITER
MSCSGQIFEAILAIPKLNGLEKNPTNLVLNCSNPGKKTQDVHEVKLLSTRRLAIGLASIAVFGNACVGNSLADDNGYWLTTPLVVPKAKNKITNAETGTRSFVKKQIYIANIGTKNRMNRIKRYAFDLLALGDLIGQDTWNYVRKYLCIKATFMYFDFDEVISAAATEDKEPLLNLANQLFDSFEKLDSAVKNKDLEQTKSCYKDTTDILQDVMNHDQNGMKTSPAYQWSI